MPFCKKCQQSSPVLYPPEILCDGRNTPDGICGRCRQVEYDNVRKRDWSRKNKAKRLVTKTRWRKAHPESDEAWNRIRRERRGLHETKDRR